MRRYQPMISLAVGVWLLIIAGLAQAEPPIAGYVTRVRGEVVVETAAGRQAPALNPGATCAAATPRSLLFPAPVFSSPTYRRCNPAPPPVRRLP